MRPRGLPGRESQGVRTEHEIVAKIKETIGSGDFLKYSIGTYGDRGVDNSGGFQEVCSTLANGLFEALDCFESMPSPIPAQNQPAPTTSRVTIPSDPPHPPRPTPDVPLHPRFRCQVIHCEKGVSLFEVTSLEEVFRYLVNHRRYTP